MSYSDYTRKLHFGSVTDGIQAMKDNEFSRITNPMESQQLSLDSDITSLTAGLVYRQTRQLTVHPRLLMIQSVVPVEPSKVWPR